MKISHTIPTFFNQTIESLKKNKVACWTYSICVETIKIVAAMGFLTLLATTIKPTSKISSKYIVRAIIEAPFDEEIFFRGLLLRGIRLFQKSPASDEEKAAQQTLRVRVSAFVFGLAHFQGGPLQILSASLGGLSYGYLSEKYETLSMGIVAHGINNFIALKAATALTRSIAPSIHEAGFYLILALIYKIGLYHFATRNLNNQKASAKLDPSTGG